MRAHWWKSYTKYFQNCYITREKFSLQKNDIVTWRQETGHLITFMENNLLDGDHLALTPSLPALLEGEEPRKNGLANTNKLRTKSQTDVETTRNRAAYQWFDNGINNLK